MKPTQPDLSSRKKLSEIFHRLASTPALAEAKLERILLEFYETMEKDILIGFFFTGKDLSKIAGVQKSFLMKAMGVLPTYLGKTPTDAHSAIPPILVGHFDRRLVLLAEVLERHALAEKDIRTWISFENSFRNVIVSK